MGIYLMCRSISENIPLHPSSRSVLYPSFPAGPWHAAALSTGFPGLQLRWLGGGGRHGGGESAEPSGYHLVKSAWSFSQAKSRCCSLFTGHLHEPLRAQGFAWSLFRWGRIAVPG